MSAETAYLVKSFEKSQNGNGVGTQVDMTHLDSKNISSFSSDPQIEYKTQTKAFYARNDQIDSDKSFNDITVNNVDELFLPFFAKEDAAARNMYLIDRSNASTVFKSEGVSNLISPMRKNPKFGLTNHDIPNKFENEFVDESKGRLASRYMNATGREEYYQTYNSQKQTLLRKYDETSKLLKPTEFEFGSATSFQFDNTKNYI